jgi:phytoene desaturase
MKVVIIGAGIGGLATANLLAQDGHEVHIYEKNAQLGGRAGQFTKDGFTFDTGPSWYLMPDVFDHYFSLLGSSTENELDLIRLSPAYKVYSGKQSLIISGDLSKDTETFESYEKGAGEKLKAYVAKSLETYHFALKHFLYSNFDSTKPFLKSEILKKGVAFSQLALKPIHSYVQKYFTHPQLQQILEYPTVFLGSSPYSAPALYSLMSALDFHDGVYYPKGTMYAVVKSLAKLGASLGVSHHLNSPVTSIRSERGKAKGIELENGTFVDADIVIANSDLHFTETQLLAPQDQTYPASYWRKKEASPSALLMYLGIEGKIPEFEHHTLLFTEDWKKNFDTIFKEKSIPSPASLYISKTSASDTTAPEGKENIFVLVPLPSGITIPATQLDTLADSYLAQIYTTTGVDLKARTVSRTLFGPNDFSTTYNSWQSSMLGPSHILRQSAFFRTPNKSKKLSNLLYVGASTVPGIGVPMCLISAELVRDRIRKEHAV